jgi:hypothetical protein
MVFNNYGWIEQRSKERTSAALKMSYRVLTAGEKMEVLNDPRYSDTTAEQLPVLANKYHAYHVVTKDIAEKMLTLTGKYNLAEGDWVEISLQPPQYNVPVIVLAEVKWSRSFVQIGTTFYTAGVSILALDRDSMDRLSCFFLEAKVRGQNPNQVYAFAK